jgi:hypothetical protein
MTHDELLEKIKREEDYLKTYAEGYGFVVTDALRAVVELHQPLDKYEGVCGGCWEEESGFSDYPCPTIQVIEKEING